VINRYTVGIGAGLLVLALLWLQFGGSIAAWSAGVGRAIKGNAAAVEELQKANEATRAAIAEKAQMERDAEEIRKKYTAAQRQIEAKQREFSRLAGINSELASKNLALSAQIAAVPKLGSLDEIHDAFRALPPPYGPGAPPPSIQRP